MVRGITTNSRHPVATASRHAAIYTRISKDSEGRALGVERQEQDCIDLAKRLGYDSWEVFQENDVSASTLSTKLRPRFQDMMDRTRRGEFSGIIAYSNSRLTRRVVELQALIDVTRATGVRIHTVASGQHDLDTADGRATMLTIAVWDQAEAERTAERVKRASQQRQEDGRWHGGVPPFGYFKQDKALHIADSEAKLIKQAASRVLDQDESLYSIVQDWNTNGVATRKQSSWKHSTLRNMLTSESLIGLNKAGKVAWEPIIDRQTHERLVEKLAPDHSRRTNPLGVKSSKYALGGGLVLCGRCKKPLYPTARQGVPTKLVCRAFANGDHPNHQPDANGNKGRVSIDSDALEAYLMEQCREHLNDNPFWEKVKNKRETAESDTAKLRAERDARQGERDRAGRAFVAGIMSEREAQAEVARLDAEIARLTERIERAHGGPTAQDAWAGREEVLDLWNEWTPGELRLFFRSMIERVTVGDWPRGMATRNTTDKEKRAEVMKARVDIDWLG